MTASNSEARKRKGINALWDEPRWQGDPDTRQDRALRALQRVYGDATAAEAAALRDALEDEGLLR